MSIAQKTMVARTCIFVHILILSFFISSHASFPPSTLIPRDTICNYTPFPKFCQLSLPSNKSLSIHDYCRLSVRQSLSMTDNFLNLVHNHLRVDQFAYALQDCHTLASFNKDFLFRTIQVIDSTITSLPYLEHEYIQTILSATLTNLQTCLDGLLETSSPSISLQNSLIVPLTNGCKSYSVSLALFLHGWSSTTTTTTKSPMNGRKLLQEIGGGVRVRETVVVNPNGSGDFTRINDAVAAAPNNAAPADGYFMIRVVAGVYVENVSIGSKKMYIMMVGDGINNTIITGNKNVVDGSTTYNSATFAVSGTGFVAVNITFQNTAGAVKHQAVAVRNSADLSVFYKCSFEAYQDTLYTHSMRQFYRKCDIYGTVDFIFGNAAAVLQNCNMYPRLPMSGQFNVITAQGRTDPNQNTGISIHNCTIKAAPDLASNYNGVTKTFLGRPWKEYSRTVYMQSNMDPFIDPAGWTEWSGDYALGTLYYGEYNNFGPGATTQNRVTWPGYHVMDPNEAANFTVGYFIQGDSWLQNTGVSYTSGLS